MANAYSRIVFFKRSISDKQAEQCHSFMQFKSKILANKQSDTFFYESLMLFTFKTLRDAFEVNDIPKLEEEVSRLFRSNAFNMTERRLHEEQRMKKYPALQDVPPKATDEEFHNRLIRRSFVPK
jgi:hypothetical protein